MSAGISRLRMLDFITRAPLDCPVAIVFGHAAVINWANPAYDHVGLEIASALGRAGYPADLLPSSLIEAGALRIDGEGRLGLGPQRYRAAVLYQPDYGSSRELAFWAKAVRGPTRIFRVGEWSHDFDGRAIAEADDLRAIPPSTPTEADCTTTVLKLLKAGGRPTVANWTDELQAWDRPGTHAAPPAAGFSVLVDGPYVRISGRQNPAGDPIQEIFTWQSHVVTVDAVGVVALRFGADGRLAALAAGGLAQLTTDGFNLTLPERADIAFVTTPDGPLQGIASSNAASVLGALRRLGPSWQVFALPEPLTP